MAPAAIISFLLVIGFALLEKNISFIHNALEANKWRILVVYVTIRIIFPLAWYFIRRYITRSRRRRFVYMVATLCILVFMSIVLTMPRIGYQNSKETITKKNMCALKTDLELKEPCEMKKQTLRSIENGSIVEKETLHEPVIEQIKEVGANPAQQKELAPNTPKMCQSVNSQNSIDATEDIVQNNESPLDEKFYLNVRLTSN